ncbi:MAG: hypothetical protein OJF55_001393 [Rhodanobacteraceae bacterium]|jgi:putative PIN family toxin of toxin-antitoxin system|nr:MAG: hypothetical protein OJF55_001393 [Rhodanobacteraceae bacterium]
MRAVVVDTNVVVSGLITGHDDAPPARILDGMLSGRFPFVVSEALLAEYRDVLNRPKLRKRHGLAPDEIESLLVALAHNAIVLEPSAGPAAPEPGDQFLWNLLVSHEGLCLVTGDALLLRARNAPASVLSPAAFISSGAKLQ